MIVTENNFKEVIGTLIKGQQILLKVGLKSDLQQIRTEHRVNLAINNLLDSLQKQGYSLHALVEPIFRKNDCWLKDELDTHLKQKLDKEFFLDFHRHEVIYKYLQHRIEREGI